MAGERTAEPLKATFNVLFVCTGNTCRSPMAEALARAELARRGWTHVRTASAGIAADPGHPASAHAVSVADRRGLDLRAHASRPLTPELVEWADLILAMSPSHLSTVARMGGEEKTALLADFAAGDEGAMRSVLDPFGGEEAEYEQTWRELEALVAGSLSRLEPIVRP